MRLDVSRSLVLAVQHFAGAVVRPLGDTLMAGQAAGLPLVLCAPSYAHDGGLPAGVKCITMKRSVLWEGPLAEHLRQTGRDQLLIVADQLAKAAEIIALSALAEAWQVSLMVEEDDEAWHRDPHIQRLLHAKASLVTLDQAIREWAMPPAAPLPDAGELFG